MNSNALDDSRRAYHNGYYVKKLEEGLEFQDVATTALYQRGIVVVAYSSRRWQDKLGENMLGAEIKRDGKFRQTGNLYIETAESLTLITRSMYRAVSCAQITHGST